MMHIIEDSKGKEVSRHKGRVDVLPDGASVSGGLPDGYVHKAKGGKTYTVRKVENKRRGEGPRPIGSYGPERIDGDWFEGTIYGEALPPTPDLQLGDEGYKEVFEELRRRDYPPIGDQLDAIWKHLNYRRTQGDELIQEADDVLGDILAVKAKHKNPVPKE
jgi:hypothetical protein|tara:strand:- start:2816 stop:3298 length:483 start_codon:yes stop_codon:yes gene_type:complete